jgi:CBS domain-containing protein
MKVAALMSNKIVSVLPVTTVADAVRIMLANRVSGLPVIDAENHLVGVITEGDLLRRAEISTDGKQPGWLKAFLFPSSAAAEYVHTHGRHVSEIMTRNPITVAPETELEEVAKLMLNKRIKRLPVVENGFLVGVISRSDLLRVLARKLIKTPEECTDKAIGQYIKDELAHAHWAPKAGIRVEVHDKVVTIEGTIFSDEERQAVVVIAENAPGVREVNDNLVFVDPGSGIAFPAV